MALQIENKALENMIADAEKAFPDECCGFVFGEETGTERLILDIQVVDNAKQGDKRRRFEITASDYMKAERYADERNLQLLGVYHSHPNHPAIPSEHDRVAAQPFFSYLILSVMDGHFEVIRSWRLNDEHQFEEENIVQSVHIKNT
jgi:proteasome lid subunit RPN8/RPN11